MGDRGLLRGRQGRGRSRSVRGPLLDRLASPRHACHAGPRLFGRAPQGRRRGTTSRSTWRPSSSRSPYPRCDGCSGGSSGLIGRTPRPSLPGRAGGAATSNAHDDAIGKRELVVKPGCSTNRSASATRPTPSSRHGPPCGTVPCPSGRTRVEDYVECAGKGVRLDAVGGVQIDQEPPPQVRIVD